MRTGRGAYNQLQRRWICYGIFYNGTSLLILRRVLFEQAYQGNGRHVVHDIYTAILYHRQHATSSPECRCNRTLSRGVRRRRYNCSVRVTYHGVLRPY